MNGDYPSVYVTYDPALGVGPILSDSGVDEWTHKDMDEDEDLGLARMYFAEALMPELKYRFEERYAAFLKYGVNATSQAEGAEAQYAEFVTALDRCDVLAEDSALRDARRATLQAELQALRTMVSKTKR